jgi:tetratricopeptide (TPR) repeat protein
MGRFAPATLALLLLASAARAGEYKPPPFGGEDIVLEEDALPEGWEALEEEATAAKVEPIATLAKSTAKAAGLNADDDVFVDGVAAKDPEGAEVVIAFVDIEVDPQGVPATLKAEAEKMGWIHRELGSPGRHLFASGPAAPCEALVKAQIAFGIDKILRLAGQRLQSGSAEKAQEFARAALGLDELAAPAWAILGMATAAGAHAASPEEQKSLWEEAVGYFEKSVREESHFPLQGPLAAQVHGEWGLGLLMQKTPEANKAAREVLKKAVGLEQFVLGTQSHWVNRYNLICAMSLLGEKPEAIKAMEELLNLFKVSNGVPAVQQFLTEQADKDPALDSIRGTPEYAEMVKRVTGGGSAPPSGV